MLRCSFCGQALIYVHGHAACASTTCPVRGRNQAECCAGETAETCPVVVVPAAPSLPATPDAARGVGPQRG